MVVTMSRRSTDAGEPSNRELKESIDGLAGEFRSWVAEHRRDHARDDARQSARDVQDALRDERVKGLGELVPRVDGLEKWQTAMEAYGRLLRLVIGTSLLGALVAVIDIISRLHP